MRPNAPGRGGTIPALAWKCFDEGNRPVCLFSLASLVEYPAPPSATPRNFVQDETNPVFDSRSTALKRCRSYWPSAELASPSTAQRNVVRTLALRVLNLHSATICVSLAVALSC